MTSSTCKVKDSPILTILLLTFLTCSPFVLVAEYLRFTIVSQGVIMTDYIEIFVTTETKKEAQTIGTALVKERLVGCVHITGPISSTCWWEGEVVTVEEYLCLLKTDRNLYPAVETALQALHSYDTPEIVALPIVAGSEKYFTWLAGELQEQA